jgi:hypothetical protein
MVRRIAALLVLVAAASCTGDDSGTIDRLDGTILRPSSSAEPGSSAFSVNPFPHAGNRITEMHEQPA